MHPPGFTRSVRRRDYLLHTPDAFVRTPLPGLEGGSAIVHVAPQMGAQFAMTSVELSAGGSLRCGPAQSFLYVLDGSLHLHDEQPSQAQQLGPGAYAYLPNSSSSLSAPEDARFLLFEKIFTPLRTAGKTEPQPRFLRGHEADVTPTALNGDGGVQVRSLLPSTPDFDFAVNTMTYEPGAGLSQVEVHSMEHGLLMLEGAGIYRLGDDWHPVVAGDAIWMAPFCPQWFAAVGKTAAKYIIYKDFNRHVLG